MMFISYIYDIYMNTDLIGGRCVPDGVEEAAQEQDLQLPHLYG